jgi:amidase
LREVDGEPEPSEEAEFGAWWYGTYGVLQWAEIWSCLGAWVEEAKPAFGPEATRNFDLIAGLDRRRVGPAARRREELFRRLRAFLGPERPAVHADDADPWRRSKAPWGHAAAPPRATTTPERSP